jgi:hypothetical protein
MAFPYSGRSEVYSGTKSTSVPEYTSVNIGVMGFYGSWFLFMKRGTMETFRESSGTLKPRIRCPVDRKASHVFPQCMDVCFIPTIQTDA